MNYLDSIQLKNGLFDLLMSFRPDLFVTVTFNLNYSYEAARLKLKRFHARLDHLQLGKNWCLSPDRTLFIAVPEMKGGTLHFHLLLRLPETARNGFVFENEAPVLWKRITPAGTFHCKRIETAEDHAKEANYLVKNAWHFRSQETYIVSSEFVGSGERKDSVSR